MLTYKILKYPHDLLRQPCTEVTNFSDDFQVFCEAMANTMYLFDGIGLAASQVGILKQMTVVDVRPYLESEAAKDWHGEISLSRDGAEVAMEFPLFIVNPKVVAKGADIPFPFDGCLSFPGVESGPTSRYDSITVEAVDHHNRPFTVKATGIMSICLQHELDHLDGTLFIDRFIEASELSEEQIVAQIKEADRDPKLRAKIKKHKPVNARNRKYDFAAE